MSLNNLWRIFQFLKFYFKAKTLYNIHSPYLYELLVKVSDLDKEYYNLEEVERIRTSFLYDHTRLKINDLGAGSSNKSLSNSISQIAKNSSSGVKKCSFLYNLVIYFKSKNILELGTNLGLATAYMSYGSPNSQLTTIEGDSNLWKYSQFTFNKLGININSLNDSFSNFFSSQKESLDNYDFCYIDGNHTFEGTMEAYNALKPQANHEKVLIFDDIYWSKGMHQAWEEIKELSQKCYTIDIFQFGIVIFSNKVQQKEHIKYIPWKYKPFSTGLMG